MVLWLQMTSFDLNIKANEKCHNPNLELVTKARVCEGAGQE
jgi:hypothetical protein